MKAITDRRSIRKYKDIPLEEEKINDILRRRLLHLPPRTDAVEVYCVSGRSEKTAGGSHGERN